MNNTTISSLKPAGEEKVLVYYTSAQKLLKFSYELALFLLIANFLVAFAALFGNLIVILLVKVYNQLRVPSNYLLANLAVADFLNALTIQGMNTARLFYCIYDTTAEQCRGPVIAIKEFTPAADAFGMTILYVNVSTLCLITMDRYISIKYSLKYFSIVTTRRVRIAIAASWVTGMVVGAMAAFLFPVKNQTRIVPEAVLLAGAVFMIVVYVKINNISRFHAKKIRTQQMALEPTNQHVKNNQRRGLRTVALIIISLFVSYFPLVLYGLEKKIFSSEQSEFRVNAREAFRHVGILLLFSKSAVNPMLYFFRSATAREFAFKMYKTVKEKLLSTCN